MTREQSTLLSLVRQLSFFRLYSIYLPLRVSVLLPLYAREPSLFYLRLRFIHSSPFLVVQGSSVHSRSRRGKSCPKVFCFGFNEIIRTARHSRRLFPSYTAEGWPVESARRSVLAGPLKHRPWAVLCTTRECTRVTPARRRRTLARSRHFFLVVCHRDAGTCLFRCFSLLHRCSPVAFEV